MIQIAITVLSFTGVLTAIVLIHELGHYWTARALGVQVRELGIGFPPRIKAFSRNGIEYSLNAIPIGGFVRLNGETDPDVPRGYAGKPVKVRAAIIVAGSTMNVLLAWAIFTILVVLPVERLESGDVLITGVAAGSPAEEAGLLLGDVIDGVNGVPIETLGDLANEVRSSPDGVTLRVLRGPLPRAVSLAPRANPPPGEGAMGVSVTLANPVFVTSWGSPFTAPWTGARSMALFVELNVAEFRQISTGESQVSVAGPVGIAQVTGEVVRLGPRPLLVMVALLSLTLGIINLLPIPALDGGRLPFLLLEALRGGRRLRPQFENMIHLAGFAILVAFIIYVTVSVDLPRLARGESLLP